MASDRDARTPTRRALDRDAVPVVLRHEHERALIAVDAVLDALDRAGWRPPARVITTAAERDALPAGCMVKQLTTGTIYRRTEDITTVPRLGMCAEIRRSPGDWYDANGNCCFDLDLPSYPTIDLPLEVLYVPTEESR